MGHMPNAAIGPLDFVHSGHHVLIYLAELNGWHWAYSIDDRRPSKLPALGACSAARAAEIATSRACWEIDEM